MTTKRKILVLAPRKVNALFYRMADAKYLTIMATAMSRIQKNVMGHTLSIHIIAQAK